MLAFKFSFLAFFLVNISIIHFTFATPIRSCQNLLLKEINFNNDKNGGLQNFKNAFKNLSKTIINDKFSKTSEETDFKTLERKLVHALVNSYFDDLFENHGINLEDMENGIVWCTHDIHGTNETIDSSNLDEMNDALVNSSLAVCLESVGKLLSYDKDIFYTEVIFQRLYEDWDESSVQNLRNQGQTSGDQGQTSGDQGQTSGDQVQTSEADNGQTSEANGGQVIKTELDELLEYMLGRPYEPVKYPDVPEDPTFAINYYNYFLEFVENLAIFLVNISIIRFTFATPFTLCQDYLAQEPNFNNGIDGGLQNFKNAFKFLSHTVIENKYSQTSAESYFQRRDRLLMKSLVNSYFNLLSDHNIQLHFMENGIVWCTHEVFGIDATIDTSSLEEWHNALLESDFAICLESVGELLTDGDDIFSAETIFQRLYDDWDIGSVQNLGNQGQTSECQEQTSEVLPDNRLDLDKALEYLLGLPFHVEYPDVPKNFAFAKKYYGYFLKFVSELESHQGTFHSIGTYCLWIGQDLVKNNI